MDLFIYNASDKDRLPNSIIYDQYVGVWVPSGGQLTIIELKILQTLL